MAGFSNLMHVGFWPKADIYMSGAPCPIYFFIFLNNPASAFVIKAIVHLCNALAVRFPTFAQQ